MAVNLGEIGKIIRVALGWTPEERAAAKAKAEAALAEAAAKERAHYASLTAEQKREYDDLTYGMMPRLRGAQDYWGKRSGDSPTGGRT